jgi:hypothetical protein
MSASTVLRYDGPRGGSGEIDFEEDLGLDPTVDTFWVDGRWRVGRRHQLQLGFTRSHRNIRDYTLEREFVWGGETYGAGLEATTTGNADILGGYYRFAILRNDRVEIGPTIGVGYLWLEARIRRRARSAPAGGVPDLDEARASAASRAPSGDTPRCGRRRGSCCAGTSSTSR